MKKDKKVYESKKLYSKKYNKKHSTIQVENEIYLELKEYLKEKNIKIKDYVSELIKSSIKLD